MVNTSLRVFSPYLLWNLLVWLIRLSVLCLLLITLIWPGSITFCTQKFILTLYMALHKVVWCCDFFILLNIVLKHFHRMHTVLYLVFFPFWKNVGLTFLSLLFLTQVLSHVRQLFLFVINNRVWWWSMVILYDFLIEFTEQLLYRDIKLQIPW